MLKNGVSCLTAAKEHPQKNDYINEKFQAYIQSERDLIKPKGEKLMIEKMPKVLDDWTALLKREPALETAYTRAMNANLDQEKKIIPENKNYKKPT